jgi:hypothetical protein
VIRTGKIRGIPNFSGKHEEKRPLGKPRRRREDNINTDLKQIGIVYKVMKWIPVVQGKEPVAGSCERDNEISGFLKGGAFLTGMSEYWLLAS